MISAFASVQDSARVQLGKPAARPPAPSSVPIPAGPGAHDAVHDPPSLLVSILPHRLQFLSIKKPAVPRLCFALLKLLLEARERSCFLSYTETDEKDVSLLLDGTLLAHFRQAMQQLPGLSIAPQQQTAQQPSSILDAAQSAARGSAPPPSSSASSGSASDAIQLIGFPLRAIQVLEGYSGHVDAAIISSVSGTLAAAHFSIFYVSTNHADYVLVQEQQLQAVLTCLADHFFLIKDEMKDDDGLDDDDDAEAAEAAAEQQQQDAQDERKDGRETAGRREKDREDSSQRQQYLHVEEAAAGEESDRSPSLPATRRSPQKSRRRAESGSGGQHSDAGSSEDEERMIREAMRRSKRKHMGSRKESESAADDGIAEEDESSEQEEWSRVSATPPTAALPAPSPLSPSPALSSLSLSASASFSSSSSLSSSLSPRPLQLQAMPYTLLLHSLAHTDLPVFFSSLLQLIFFPPSLPSSLSSPRFFSLTMIDNDYSLITPPPLPSPSLHPSLLHALQRSQQWSVIEALGVFRYDEAGLVSRISRPLSEAGLRFFYFSSWRTGFVIVHKEDLDRAKACLRRDFELVA